MRKILFEEQVPLSSLLIIKSVHAKKIHASISENAFFGLMNYCIYKLQREKDMEEKNAENVAKEKIKWLFQGNWQIISLEFEALMPLLEKSDVPFEDLYQYHCAKNKKLQLVTHNTKDFEQTTGVLISTPKEFLQQLKNQKILSEKDFAYP
ncbi:hypothetical protein HZC31_07290 [Candidatus Woesearchaeota archaeon]|nr:hypothetical protein [Candidatus Woesearchaeota archaeon]